MPLITEKRLRANREANYIANKAWDSPDGVLWKEATDKEYYILEDERNAG